MHCATRRPPTCDYEHATGPPRSYSPPPPPWGWAPLWKHQPMTAWSLVVEQTLSPPVRFRGACRTGGVHAPCRFGSTEDITEERMTTSGSWMPQLLVLSPRSGGPFKEATGRIQKRQPTTARPVPWANSGRFRRGFVPITCLAVLDLGLPEGRSLGPTLGGREGPWAWLITSSLCWSRVHAPGLVLPLGAKVDSKQTPSQGKASSDGFLSVVVGSFKAYSQYRCFKKYAVS